MKLIRERVLQIMDELEKLSEHDYRTFELALALFLRADKDIAEMLSDEELDELDSAVYGSDSFMSDDLKDQVDEIIEGSED